MDENLKVPEKKEDLKSIRTYESDVAFAIQKDNTSVSQIVLAEKDRQHKNGIDTLGENQKNGLKNKMILILSGLFVLGGIGILSYFYFNGIGTQTFSVQKTYQEIITTDIDKNISVTGFTHAKLVKTLTDERDKDSVALSSILGLILQDGTATSSKKIETTKLFSLVAPSIPAPLLRSFDDRSFSLGIHSFGGNQLFLLLKVTSYDNAFAGMLSWEDQALKELGPIFIVPSQKKTSVDTLVSSSTKETVSLLQSEFEDVVIKNKDARVIRDEKGAIIFLYSFIDKDTLLFTGSENTLAEILSRLRTARLVR